MKKLLVLMFAVFFTAITFTACNAVKMESGWDKAKKAHAVAKAAGAAAIKHDVVSQETAQKLKKVNTITEKLGGTTQKVYTGLKSYKEKNSSQNKEK